MPFSTNNIFGYDKQAIVDLFITTSLKVLFALAILLLGFWLSKKLQKLIIRALKKTNLEPTFVSFVGNISYYVLLVVFCVLCLAQLGIQTSSLVALLGASTLAIGLALQSSLSNVAAGILLVLFNYFRVGEMIEVAGIEGVVESIEILSTTICTYDNRLVTIPNKQIIENNIINHVGKPLRRIDLVIGVGYEENIDHVRSSLQWVLDQNSEVCLEPAPAIALGELGESSVKFYVRPWVKSTDYFRLKLQLTEAIKRKLDEENISIPFPQRDIHLIQPETKELDVQAA
ncbi:MULTISPECIES: mechanosensitive ion channel family protein [unclassified Synechocystis]|uniref:mechanosensitive ion channel family protein n=1 Tax=unclassified Synechocystis TaxID=2640012 RepID=UPI00048E37B3|nr:MULTISPECIES: mechanosensitive ion channel domain-containing protein [unclassified Synechocystis]MCT0254788.1 mechanosensitive ion channel [Synechocystis sp. CS-94]